MQPQGLFGLTIAHEPDLMVVMATGHGQGIIRLSERFGTEHLCVLSAGLKYLEGQ